jgi:hypothetical protein
MRGVSDAREFSHDFDDEYDIGPNGSKAYYGLNVMRGLVTGINDFIRQDD